MTSTLLEQAGNTNEERLVDTIVMAFAADPAVRWMYPDPHQYLAHFPDFVRAFAGKSFEFGTAEVVNSFACAALWLPPGVQPDESTIMGVLQRRLSEQQLPEMFQLLEQMAAHHPNEPHWYLPLMGVDPSQQGRGCGSTLLRRSLARCDRDRLPAYLEATNPRNAALYERFGFKRIGRIQAGSSPEIIPMLRVTE